MKLSVEAQGVIKKEWSEGLCRKKTIEIVVAKVNQTILSEEGRDKVLVLTGMAIQSSSKVETFLKKFDKIAA